MVGFESVGMLCLSAKIQYIGERVFARGTFCKGGVKIDIAPEQEYFAYMQDGTRKRNY